MMDLGSSKEPAEGVVYLILACYLFFGVSILCDEYLCPALDKLCDQYKIPPTIAAATLISFGSSAPEIVISTLGAASDKTLLSIPAVLVSALIAFGAIPPLVVLAAGEMTLRVRDVLRDAIAYALVLVVFIVANDNGTIGRLPAAGLILCYLIYLVIVYKCRDKSDDNDSNKSDAKEEIADESGEVNGMGLLSRAGKMEQKLYGKEESAHLGLVARIDKLEQDLRLSGQVSPDLLSRVSTLEEKLLQTHQEDEEESDESEEEKGALMKVVCAPWDYLLAFTVPKEHAIGGFFVSLSWLCLLSYGAMKCAELVVDRWHIGVATAGITLLAWGGQLPDTLAAVALAKDGKPDEAICQAIASQVINISIGLGLPLLMSDVLKGRPAVTHQHQTVMLIAGCVLFSILAYVLTMLPVKNGSGTITRSKAGLLGIVYIGIFAGIIALAELRKTTST